MGARHRQEEHDDQGRSDLVESLASSLLPIMARKKAANTIPVNAGNSFFYEVPQGWESDLLKKDDDTHMACGLYDLELLFSSKLVKTIFIPAHASVTRDAALKVCRRQAQAKTIFFECPQAGDAANS